MALKLRHIHDALQDEVKRKVKRLIDNKRGVEERNSQVREQSCQVTLDGSAFRRMRGGTFFDLAVGIV